MKLAAVVIIRGMNIASEKSILNGFSIHSGFHNTNWGLAICAPNFQVVHPVQWVAKHHRRQRQPRLLWKWDCLGILEGRDHLALQPLVWCRCQPRCTKRETITTPAMPTLQQNPISVASKKVTLFLPLSLIYLWLIIWLGFFFLPKISLLFYILCFYIIHYYFMVRISGKIFLEFGY